VVAGADVNHWWDNGANAIAFTRGDKGFVAINNETTSLDTTITTGMAAGTYLDVIAGNSIQVDAAGAIHLTLPARSAIAIDTATRQ
jgi:alpha-amylase